MNHVMLVGLLTDEMIIRKLQTVTPGKLYILIGRMTR